jgi:hypothetical protein
MPTVFARKSRVSAPVAAKSSSRSDPITCSFARDSVSPSVFQTDLYALRSGAGAGGVRGS